MHRKIQCFVRVAMLEKLRVGLEKNVSFSIDFSSKIDYKSIEKSRNTIFAAKIDEKSLPGTAFLGKCRFLVIFGLPRGTQKITKRMSNHWGKPLMGAILCYFGHLNPFFSILHPFWVHSGSLLGWFLVNLAVLRCCFVILLPFLLSCFCFLFFGVCGWYCWCCWRWCWFWCCWANFTSLQCSRHQIFQIGDGGMRVSIEYNILYYNII